MKKKVTKYRFRFYTSEGERVEFIEASSPKEASEKFKKLFGIRFAEITEAI